MNFTQNNKAVSSIIGTLLLVSLTVIMVSLIIFSIHTNPTQPQPPQAKLSFESSFDNPSYLQIRHKGGDPINFSQITIIAYLNGFKSKINLNGTLKTGNRIQLPILSHQHTELILIDNPSNKPIYTGIYK